MPRRTIATENRVGAGAGRFPRLEFKNKGERHRVLLFQKDEDGQPVVWQEYVHFLRKPQFGDDGMPKMTLKDSKRDDSEKYEDYDTDFQGNPICLGDPAVIEADGYDPSACPVCAAVPNAPAEAKLHPQLRFAANVVEYALAPGTWAVQKPLSAKVVIWAFAAGTYDDIISQQEQHGELLQKQDLTIEVVNPGFRNVKMGVMAPSGWQETPTGGAYLAELLASPANIASDDQLRQACGRDAKRLFMEEDLSVVLKKWRKALAVREGGTAAGFGGGSQDLAAGLAELQRANPAAAALAQAAAAPDPFAAAGQGHANLAAAAQAAQQPGATPQDVMAAAQSPDPFAPPATGTSTAAPAAASPSGTGSPAAGPAPVSDPFAAAPTSAPTQPPPTTAAPSPEPPSAPPAGQPDPFGNAGTAGAAAAQSPSTAAPAATPPTAPPSDGKPKSFDDLINSLGGQA